MLVCQYGISGSGDVVVEDVVVGVGVVLPIVSRIDGGFGVGGE